MIEATFEPAVNRREGLAPHSREAEEAVLGSVLLCPDVLNQVAAFLAADEFFMVRNRLVWEALLALKNRHEDIDVLTVTEELKRQPDAIAGNRLTAVGGPAYLTSLLNHTPTHLHAETYAHVI